MLSLSIVEMLILDPFNDCTRHQVEKNLGYKDWEKDHQEKSFDTLVYKLNDHLDSVDPVYFIVLQTPDFIQKLLSILRVQNPTYVHSLNADWMAAS